LLQVSRKRKWRAERVTIRVLYPDAFFTGAPDLELKAAGEGVEIEAYRGTELSAIPAESCSNADVVMVSGMQLGEGELNLLPRCRIVIRTGVGYDTVDLEACGRRGVPVCNVPDFGTTEVADHAIAMILALARGIASFNENLRANVSENWNYRVAPTIRRLTGSGFGIIGLGAIGTAVALRARAFGMTVRFYDPYAAPGTDLALGVERAVSLEELLSTADVLSIHAPLTRETRGLINAITMTQMRPGAFLINTARGPIVDTSAVLEGLKTDRLAGVALDVLPEEPPDLSDPLVAAWYANEPWIRGRVILSPHAAFYSPASFSDQRRKAIETAMRYIRAGVLANCVNRQFLTKR
jgi:phosphoglycerate dehydrogenase-like enzyme